MHQEAKACLAQVGFDVIMVFVSCLSRILMSLLLLMRDLLSLPFEKAVYDPRRTAPALQLRLPPAMNMHN
jgi:hypothetical protein